MKSTKIGLIVSFILLLFSLVILLAGVSYLFCIIPVVIGSALIVCVIIRQENKERALSFRPVVHIWTHNGITRVMPHTDWKLWHQEKERGELAGLTGGILRPDSKILIQFSDSTTYPESWLTGRMNQYRKLIRDCRVEKAEMQICPGYPALGFKTAWKMVHGADSEPRQ